jgi:hypothetical protein
MKSNAYKDIKVVRKVCELSNCTLAWDGRQLLAFTWKTGTKKGKNRGGKK